MNFRFRVFSDKFIYSVRCFILFPFFSSFCCRVCLFPPFSLKSALPFFFAYDFPYYSPRSVSPAFLCRHESVRSIQKASSKTFSSASIRMELPKLTGIFQKGAVLIICLSFNLKQNVMYAQLANPKRISFARIVNRRWGGHFPGLLPSFKTKSYATVVRGGKYMQMSTFIKIAFETISKSPTNTPGFTIWMSRESNSYSKNIPQSYYWLLVAVLLNSLIEFVQITVTATSQLATTNN